MRLASKVSGFRETAKGKQWESRSQNDNIEVKRREVSEGLPEAQKASDSSRRGARTVARGKMPYHGEAYLRNGVGICLLISFLKIQKIVCAERGTLLPSFPKVARDFKVRMSRAPSGCVKLADYFTIIRTLLASMSNHVLEAPDEAITIANANTESPGPRSCFTSELST